MFEIRKLPFKVDLWGFEDIAALSKSHPIISRRFLPGLSECNRALLMKIYISFYLGTTQQLDMKHKIIKTLQKIVLKRIFFLYLHSNLICFPV